MKIPLVEVFRSPQGEGYNAGRDAIFVRFSGCPLSCVFADGAVCDTPYQRALLKPSLDDLFQGIIPDLLGFPPEDQKRVTLERRVMLVLTGGEPTAAPSFGEVAKRGIDAGFYVAVETNGTRWRDELALVHWVTVSPKDQVKQGSPGRFHNHNPQSAKLDSRVIDLMVTNRTSSGEYRYVIGGADTPAPPRHPSFRNYLSPAALSDGEGMEWRDGFRGFAPGAVERCLEIQKEHPGMGWRISLQTHKLIGVR